MGKEMRAAVVAAATVVVMLATVLGARVASAAAAPSTPDGRLLTYLWNYQDWLLRPYVVGVILSGGHTVRVNGLPRLAGATAKVHVSLRDQPKLTNAARHICRIAANAVRTLHLRPVISAVQVWSVEGRRVARC